MNQTQVTEVVADWLGYHADSVSIVRAIQDPSCPKSDVIIIETPDAVLSVTVEILAQP